MSAWIIVEDWIVNACCALVAASSKAFLALACASSTLPLVSIVKDVNEILGGITLSHIKDEVIHVGKFLTEILDDGVVELLEGSLF